MMTTLKKRYAWLASAALLLALLLVASITITPAVAQTPPPLPVQTHQFYGHVTINGAAAPAGTAVQAYVDGILNASTTVDSQGRYGLAVTGNSGQSVTFKVGITDASQSATFQGGAITQLNLFVVTTTMAVSTSAASNVGSRTATLNGNLTNMGGFSSVNIYFQYGTTTAYGSTTTSQARTATGTFTADISGLTPNTLYNFRAVASSGNTTAYGSNITFTTTPSQLAVTTGDATSITATGATLNGNLTDLGANTSVQVYFQYGTTPSYGTNTDPEAKTATGAFNKPVTGLLSNTTYHYRAVAVGSTTVYGANKIFTTQVGTLAVSTGSATSISATTATLNGTLTGLGANPSANVYFQYGTTTAYGSTTPMQSMSSVGGFSAPVSGLSPSTTYNFRAVAQAGGGTPVYGPNMIFTTSASSGGTSPPHQFYGTVYIGGALAPSGIAIAAYVNGVSAASTTTDSSGRYGYTTLFYVPGTSGSAVTFYVGGTIVPQTATYMSGGMTGLNLYSTQTALTVTCSATYATATTATLSGTVTSLGPGDTSAAVSFEWGTSPTALTGVPATPSTVTSAGQSFTATITGLTATQTYYYRAKAIGNVSSTTAYCPPSGTNTYVHSPPGTLTITTASLPNGTVGTAYSQTLQATGGTTPYSWSIVSGNLPEGLNLTASTGVISGTPTTANTYNFTVRVTDSATPAATAQKTLSITISTTPPSGPQLIGASPDVEMMGGYSGDYFILHRFPARQTGNVTTIKVKAYTSGAVKVAIYSDIAGNPGTLLGSASGTATANRWNDISITSIPITQGTHYWLAFNSSTQVVGWNTSQAAPIRYKYMPYSTFSFPDSAGTGFETISIPTISLMAGY